jgi:uracil-DNA glycosylase
MMRNWGILVAVLAVSGCEAPEEEGEYVDFEIVPDDGKYDSASAAQWSGSSLEFDPGPSESWAQLFAQVPNYRAISRQLGATWLAPGADGKTTLQTVNEQRAATVPSPMPAIPSYTLTGDKFRFEMGPLFYRGRLDGSARVLVVGQDAATDEALAHRTFIGGTGQKVQNFLNMIGITKSYVAMNTFIYSIYEQYDEFTKELATKTAIKDYRNQMFKKVFAENQIELIVSFGAAAHESVRIYRDELLGGKLPSNIVWVQCVHPGSAGIPDTTNPDPKAINQAALSMVAESFAKGWKKVWDWRASHRTWLKPDSDGIKSKWSKFYYRGTDIPYRDMPYGTSREIGRGGTKSERAKSGLQVQLRSLAGVRYEAPAIAFPTTSDKAHSGYVAATGDLAWEPAKSNPHKFDTGPSPALAQLLSETPTLQAVAAEAAVTVANDFVQPVWLRGKTDGSARVVVLADDDGVDAMVAGRALVGDAGQKIQHLLGNIGVAEYLLIDVVPYMTANLADEDAAKLVNAPSLLAFRNRLLAQLLGEQVDAVILVGKNAQDAWAAAALKSDVAVVAIEESTDKEIAVPSWNAGLLQLKTALVGSTGLFKNYSKVTFNGLRTSVPRTDLPWGVPLWFGSSGNLSQQADEHWVFWNAPKWVSKE